jgi:hypothetical protein
MRFSRRLFVDLGRLLLAALAGGLISGGALAFPATIAIDGKRLALRPLDVLRTPTGEWPVADLGRVGDLRIYLFTYRQKPEWYSLCILRAPREGAIDESRHSFTLDGEAISISALPGSMKCADNGEPVAPSMDRLRDAVIAKRVLPYSERAFDRFGPRLRTRGKDNIDHYRPDRIYGRSSSFNAIGIVSGQGGEAASSRGFVSETDARMIAAALDRDSNAFSSAAKRARIETLYGLSLPNLVIWSDRGHQMRDPQVPFPGDRPYTNEGGAKGADSYKEEGKWTAPEDYPYLNEINAEAGKIYAHGRDEAHLFNHGYAYWLATGDPRAALLQQAIMAYALASNYRRAPGKYLPRFGYQRTTLNQFSAMWKLRDVAANVVAQQGNIFWPRTRAEKMNTEMWAGWKASIRRLDLSQSVQDRSVSIFRGIDSNDDNAYSNFMIQIYGPEAAYLWASAGEPVLLMRIAENFVLRFGEIGGARGVYGTGSGSGFPILVKGQMPYRDRASFVSWVNTNSTKSADSFDGASPHTVMRGYWALRLARDARDRGWLRPVAGLDEAIRKTEQAGRATKAWRYPGILGWKHAGVDFSGAGAPRAP